MTGAPNELGFGPENNNDLFNPLIAGLPRLRIEVEHELPDLGPLIALEANGVVHTAGVPLDTRARGAPTGSSSLPRGWTSTDNGPAPRDPVKAPSAPPRGR